MRKLLAANFSRLWKSRIFWTAQMGMALWGLFMFALFLYNADNMGQMFTQSNAHTYFFYVYLFIGAVIAVFASLFIGTEYADGTIRNKLMVGHSRWAVYAANLLVVCGTGCLLCGIHFLTSLVCVPFLGFEFYSFFSHPLRCIFQGLLIVLCYGALFTMIAMLDSAKARCAVVSLLLSLSLILGGMMVYSRVTMEETKVQMVMMEDGRFERQVVPNPRYLTGTARNVFRWIDACLPGSQAFHAASGEELFDQRGAVCMVGLSCAITAAGIAGFKKKDIK